MIEEVLIMLLKDMIKRDLYLISIGGISITREKSLSDKYNFKMQIDKIRIDTEIQYDEELSKLVKGEDK